MLPTAHRMRSRREFTRTVRHGRASSRSTLTVHTTCLDEGPARVGLIVSKAVGGSVVRHQVSRRLRGVVAPHVGELPDSTGLVIRALPAAATARSRDLSRDLQAALQRLGLVRT